MTSPAAGEMINVRVAAVRLAQYRCSLGPASGPAKMATPVRATIAGCPPRDAFITDVIPMTMEIGVPGTRYPWPIRNPSYWMLPNPKARTTMGRLMAMTEDAEKDMLGTGGEGRFQDMASEVAWPSIRTARPTGGTRGFPMRRPRRYPLTAGPATAKFPTVTSISRVT